MRTYVRALIELRTQAQGYLRERVFKSTQRALDSKAETDLTR